ncbi:MAG: hypothetical protein ON057_001058 [Glomeribacter sp. 1016415]|nr:hypothetical protein [Glomeribacter sp. 1016415]
MYLKWILSLCLFSILFACSSIPKRPKSADESNRVRINQTIPEEIRSGIK